jgi:hypothetical protein
MRSPHKTGDRAEGVVARAPYLALAEARSLIDLARRHELTWEVWPERQVFTDGVRQIGFSIELYGKHDHPGQAPTAGCAECVAVYDALHRIAEAILPRGEHATRYEIRRFERKLYPDSSGSGQVRLNLQLLHRAGFDAPPDACERDCLAEIEGRLVALGATAGARHLGSG